MAQACLKLAQATQRLAQASKRLVQAFQRLAMASQMPVIAWKLDRQMDGWMDGRTDGTSRFPLYSTGLCPLRYPPRLLPCLPNSYPHKILKQGKGTNHHLLSLGN